MLVLIHDRFATPPLGRYAQNVESNSVLSRKLASYASGKLGDRLIEVEQHPQELGNGVSETLASRYSMNKVRVIGYGEYANQCVASALQKVAFDLTERGVHVKKAKVRLERSIGFYRLCGNQSFGVPVVFDKEKLQGYRNKSSAGIEDAQTEAVLKELSLFKKRRKREAGV